MHKARSITKCFSCFGVEELDYPTESPDHNPIKHLWMDGLECQLQTRPAEFTNGLIVSNLPRVERLVVVVHVQHSPIVSTYFLPFAFKDLNSNRF